MSRTSSEDLQEKSSTGIDHNRIEEAKASMPSSFVENDETSRKMLLIRLSEAAGRIREEAELIRNSNFSDSTARLMRILGEVVEEQKQALHGASK